ncbi:MULTISPECIES: flagellar brake protein [Thermaerobacter]|uniref:Flagellar brake protein n=1 Tax=Thermaerobacter composti TaxID=554949 RepID=A0ABZ0QRH2_9FIRM|nr:MULTISPECIES: flagellar brake protein [Thermaerobacter]PZN03678.1 MAG: pilus assembly protein PilZ [Bacillota bacterium]QBS37826.1 flagellar brake protein [Thermaerobacter sp. FW80]WPD19986.1 flagellar brake protein [Thermaerobacter composti]
MGDVEPLPLEVNQPVEIAFVDEPPAGVGAGPYRTHVLASGPSGIVLALPMARHRWVVPRPGQAVKVVYRDPRDRGSDRGVYGFVTVVVEARVEPEPELHLAPPARVERVQRRHWVRLDVRLPVRLEREGDPPEVLSGHTLDVSGGGARVAVPKAPAVGEHLRVEMGFPGWVVRATARVVRVEPGAPPAVGLAFVEIDGRLQDRIAGFILNEQARRRRLLG